MNSDDEFEEHMEDAEVLIVAINASDQKELKEKLLQVIYRMTLMVDPLFMVRPHQVRFSEN